jgi:hypothetical protein
MQTDIALSESTCQGNTIGVAGGTSSGCTVPPQGPGGFYPYWSQALGNGGCSLEFGNVSSGFGVTDFGKDAQYGTDQFNQDGYPQFIGATHFNPCTFIFTPPF